MVSVSSCWVGVGGACALVPLAPVAGAPLNSGDHALLLPESAKTKISDFRCVVRVQNSVHLGGRTEDTGHKQHICLGHNHKRIMIHNIYSNNSRNGFQ